MSSAFPAVWIARSVGMFVKRDTSKDTSTSLSSWCEDMKCFDTTCDYQSVDSYRSDSTNSRTKYFEFENWSIPN